MLDRPAIAPALRGRSRSTSLPIAAHDRAQDGDHDRTLALGGLAALGVLSLAWFPLHVPSVAWPWLLFLAWIFRSATESGSHTGTDTNAAAAAKRTDTTGHPEGHI